MTLFRRAYLILRIVRTIHTMNSKPTTPTKKNIIIKLTSIPLLDACKNTVTELVPLGDVTKNPRTQEIG